MHQNTCFIHGIEGLFTLILLVPAVLRLDFCGLRKLRWKVVCKLDLIAGSNHREISRSIFSSGWRSPAWSLLDCICACQRRGETFVFVLCWCNMGSWIVCVCVCVCVCVRQTLELDKEPASWGPVSGTIFFWAGGGGTCHVSWSFLFA